MLLFIATVIITVGILYLRNVYSYWERHGVKGPKPIWFFGNLFKIVTFQKHNGAALDEWYNTNKDAPYVGYYKLLTPAVMVRDPELQREILVKSFPSFHKNDVQLSSFDDLTKTNPFFLNGEEWKKNRTMFGTFFAPNKLKPVLPSMLQVGKEWEQYIRSFGPNKELDAKDICRRFTTETMLRTTFSINGNTFHNDELLQIGESLFNPDTLTAIKVMIAFIVPVFQKILNVALLPEKMANRFKSLVFQQIKMRESGAVKCDDVLQNILNSRDKSDISDLIVASIAFGFFIESYETSSNALMLALYELARNPHIQEELARTIEEAVEANNGEVTYELVQKHEYLDKVLQESMRRRPLFFGLQKLCTKSYTLPLVPGQKEPVTIPAGTPISLPFGSVFQDPKYFPDPEVFDPERFSPEGKASRPKSAYMPFSDGPRMCIGMLLGQFNLKCGLFQIIRSFDIKLGPSQKPFKLHPLSFFNIPKDGVKLILTPRKTA